MSYNRNLEFGNLLSESKNTFNVGDEYRTNPLSQIPGGDVIRVRYKNGSIRVYDKIKNVEAYIKYLMSKSHNEIDEVITL